MANLDTSDNTSHTGSNPQSQDHSIKALVHDAYATTIGAITKDRKTEIETAAAVAGVAAGVAAVCLTDGEALSSFLGSGLKKEATSTMLPETQRMFSASMSLSPLKGVEAFSFASISPVNNEELLAALRTGSRSVGSGASADWPVLNTKLQAGQFLNDSTEELQTGFWKSLRSALGRADNKAIQVTRPSMLYYDQFRPSEMELKASKLIFDEAQEKELALKATYGGTNMISDGPASVSHVSFSKSASLSEKDDQIMQAAEQHYARGDKISASKTLSFLSLKDLDESLWPSWDNTLNEINLPGAEPDISQIREVCDQGLPKYLHYLEARNAGTLDKL